MSFKSLIKAIISLSDDKKVKINYLNNVIKNNAEILIKIMTFDDLKFITTEYEIPAIYSMLIFKILLKYADKNFANKLTEIYGNDITNFYRISDEKIRKLIIATIIKYNGKEFLISNFDNINTILYIFTPSGVSVKDDIKSQKLINKIISIGGKELIYKLITNTKEIGNQNLTYITLLLYNVNKENFKNVFNNLIKFGGKDFVNNLDKDILWNIYYEYSDFESLTHKLLKVGGKEFIDNNRNNISTFATSYRDISAITDIFDMYDTKQTPMNEIFNSLTSLQEELNEQNKVNVKQKNLEKVRQFLLEKKNSLIEQDLDEARRNPEVNYQPIISKQIEQFVNKYKGQEDLLFISFRRDINVTFINPKNVYGTPTGIYTYPWLNFYDNIFEKYVKNYLIPDTSIEIPYQGSARYIFLYKLKSNQGVLTNQTTYNDTLPYANKLFNLVKNNEYALEIVNTYINDYERYITDYYNYNEYARTSFGDVHKFWILLYLVGEKITKGKTQDTIGNLCRNIGVNGFVDFGAGYIHPNEPMQAVFFRGRELFDDIKIIDTQKQKIYTQNLDAIFNDEDFIKNLDADRLENLLSNARNKSRSEDFNQIFLKLISNIDNAPIDSIFNLFRYAPTVDIKNQLINKLLKNNDFLEKVKDYDFNYFLNNLNNEQLKYVLLNKPNIILEYGYEINKTILKFIKEDKDLFEIYNKIAKEFYRKEKYIPSDYFWFLRDEEINKIFLDPKNRTDLQTFIWSISTDDIDALKNIKKLFDLGVNENEIFDAIKLYDFEKPENIFKLLKGKILKNYLIYIYNDRDKKIQSGGITNLFSTSERPINLLNFFIKNIGEEKAYELIDGIFDENDRYELFTYSKNIEEIRQIKKIISDRKNSNPTTPMNEIFNSLTSLQEELNEQRKVSIKESNLMKVQNFIKNKKNNQ